MTSRFDDYNIRYRPSIFEIPKSYGASYVPQVGTLHNIIIHYIIPVHNNNIIGVEDHVGMRPYDIFYPSAATVSNPRDFEYENTVSTAPNYIFIYTNLFSLITI